LDEFVNVKMRNYGRLVDLSHEIEEDIPVFKGIEPPKIYPSLTHEESRVRYGGLAEFELTKIEMITSIGTYLDSPYHRFKEMKNISDIKLEEVILEGFAFDVSVSVRKSFGIAPELLGCSGNPNLEGKAILIHTGWGRFWKKKEYFKHPFITKELAEYFVRQKVKLVGIDTINVDSPEDLSRPAHTILLKNNILIVENLTNVDKLVNKKFRFYAVPIKIKAAAFPVRAFAEIIE